MNKDESPSIKLTRMVNDLEEHQKTELENLRNNFHGLVESLAPGNLVRNIFQQVKESPELKRKAIVSLVGIAATAVLARFVTKKIKGNKAENLQAVPGSAVPRSTVSKILPPVLKLLVAVFLNKKDQQKKRDAGFQESRVP